MRQRFLRLSNWRSMSAEESSVHATHKRPNRFASVPRRNWTEEDDKVLDAFVESNGYKWSAAEKILRGERPMRYGIGGGESEASRRDAQTQMVFLQMNFLFGSHLGPDVSATDILSE